MDIRPPNHSPAHPPSQPVTQSLAHPATHPLTHPASQPVTPTPVRSNLSRKLYQPCRSCNGGAQGEGREAPAVGILSSLGATATGVATVLREVAEAGRVEMQIVEVSASRIDVVWPHYVTWNSVWRLTQKASQKGPTFRILGHPQGIVAEPDVAESVVDPQTAPPASKKRRVSGATSEAASAPCQPKTSSDIRGDIRGCIRGCISPRKTISGS